MDERENWDNLSRGKTYTKVIEADDREEEAARQDGDEEKTGELSRGF